jgi:acyl carrier protein
MTMNDPRAETVLQIIAERTGIDRARLQPDTDLDALGITSLTLIEAVFEIETHFGVEISTDGILLTPDVTVQQLLDRVLESLPPAAPAGGAAAG